MRRSARAIAALATTLSAATAFAAGPIIFEETAKIGPPDPSWTQFPVSLAVEGDTIIAVGKRETFTTQPYEHMRSDYTSFQFRRQSDGRWTYVRNLIYNFCDEGERAEDTCPQSVAIRNGVAVVNNGSRLWVYRRRPANGEFFAEPVANVPSGPGDVAVGTNVILASQPVCDGLGLKAYRPDASGVWTETYSLDTSTYSCDSWGMRGYDIDLSAGNRWIAAEAEPVGPPAHIFEPSGTTWTETTTLTSPSGSFGFLVAMDDNRAFTNGPLTARILAYNRAGGAWTHAADIATPDGAARSFDVLKVRNRLFASSVTDPHRRGSVGVFSANASGQYEEVAKLVSSSLPVENRYLGHVMDAYIDGSFSRVVTSGVGGVHVFDVNQTGRTPAPTQETFELGNSANWTPIAGSSFSVVSTGGSQVYRQSSLAGDAGAFVTSLSRANQSIEADVRPTAVNGTDRWVGLVVRRTDASNYYYLTLRQSNVLQLRRMVNGGFLTLASASLPFTLNRNYRLRLEAVGTRLRAYVDGRMVLETADSSLTQGHAGVQMYRAQADFDNVVLSADPQLTLLEHRTDRDRAGLWSFTHGSWTSAYSGGQIRLAQQDTAGDGRAVTRVEANDQILQVRASGSFLGGTGDRWFGLIARYVDAQNFYYLTVRRDNTVSLRKLVNGTVTVLDTAQFNVSNLGIYALRLEAVGTSLRAYIDGNLVLEANDSSYAKGKYGLATYKTAATFDEFVAWEP
jgi:hypothetical protein